jgi:hypothetical protein
MPRKARVPKRRRAGGEWVEQFKAGTRPEYGTPEHDEFVGWTYFAEPVPGLPPAESDEGRALWWASCR